jgi:hypothetical protein
MRVMNGSVPSLQRRVRRPERCSGAGANTVLERQTHWTSRVSNRGDVIERAGVVGVVHTATLTPQLFDPQTVMRLRHGIPFMVGTSACRESRGPGVKPATARLTTGRAARDRRAVDGYEVDELGKQWMSHAALHSSAARNCLPIYSV